MGAAWRVLARPAVGLPGEHDEKMTSHLLHGKPREATSPDVRFDLAIGETEPHVFTCPSCARPLSNGTSKCPGCGVRLVMGVMLKRASGILALGMVFGIALGGAATASAIALSLRVPTTVAVVTPTVAPADVGPTAQPPQPVTVPVVVVVPQTALSALSGTAVVNGRIAVDAATLSSTAARSSASAIEIARALRSLAADAALGTDLVGRLASWRDAAPVMADLDQFYFAMAENARAALRLSLSDTTGYRNAAAKMATVLLSLGKVDASSRTLASTVELELPPVAIPGAN